MYIDIGTCICKSISIYVSRDAYIERGFTGEKSQYTKSKAMIGGVDRICRRDAVVQA